MHPIDRLLDQSPLACAGFCVYVTRENFTSRENVLCFSCNAVDTFRPIAKMNGDSTGQQTMYRGNEQCTEETNNVRRRQNCT